MSLQSKIAFVSGASRPQGNGRAIALALARKGADVGVSGWNHMEGAISVAFLATVEAKYMTGAVMNMLGGLDLFVF